MIDCKNRDSMGQWGGKKKMVRKKNVARELIKTEKVKILKITALECFCKTQFEISIGLVII